LSPPRALLQARGLRLRCRIQALAVQAAFFAI
jgi:hypothetical protein